MRRFLRTGICLSYLFFHPLGVYAAAQAPDWIGSGKSAQYPASCYVTGYGMAEGDNEAARLENAVQKARADLSAKFIVKIQNSIYINEAEASGKARSEYRNTVSAQTQIKMIAVDVLQWDDRHNRTAHALAVMDIEKALTNYSMEYEELAGKIRDLVKLGEEAESSGNIRKAVDFYRGTFPLFIEAGEIKAILQVLRGKSAFGELESLGEDDIPVSQYELESRIGRLLIEKITDARDAALSIKETLKSQWKERTPLVIDPLRCRDTDFCSQFSNYFRDILRNELAGEFKVIDSVPTVKDKTGVSVLTGNYWVAGENIRIIVVVTVLKSGSKPATAMVDIPKANIEKEGISLEPRNYLQAMEDYKLLLPGDVISGDIFLEVWTSRGVKSLILKKDDPLEFLVRVNQPCYLRVIYHLANGVRYLLFNNYYIDPSKVNRAVTLPNRYLISAPFGVERFQVFASVKEFPDVETRSAVIDGVTYDTIFAEDFGDYLLVSRGIKKDDRYITPIVDKFITITTMP